MFVYGTLRRSGGNRYARLLDLSSDYLGTARLRGKLYHLGNFPGIKLVRQENEWVTGDLFRLRSPRKTLERLDKYEGSKFRRVPARAFFASGEIPCWVYEYTPAVNESRRILSGDWLLTAAGTPRAGRD